MELKNYQVRVIENLRTFLRLYASSGSAAGAYARVLERSGARPGEAGVPGYKDDLDGVPSVCLRVPTGGGKTFIAANAAGVIFDELPEVPADVLVWLVPRREILRQTLKQLRNSSSPLRRALDRDFAHRVEVLTKEDGLAGRSFTRATVEDQLTIFVLSYDSFKRAEGRRAYAENSQLADLTAYQRRTGQARTVRGADESALISALAGTNPVVVVDESHHAKSELSVQMLRDLNPRFVLELSATPRKSSNVISRVAAFELKSEQMVKLPVVVYRRHSKEDVVANAILLQRRLEGLALDAEEKGGRYIRPIVLLQAERKASGDEATFEKLKEQLIEAGIPSEQVAVRTASVDELSGLDLMERTCPIRYVITIEALAEGWDCPFAYVLASVANKSSKVSVEQLVGRVLRQPYACRSVVPALDIAYVLTSSDDFEQTLGQVIEGLNDAGFSREDVRTDDGIADGAGPFAQPFGGGNERIPGIQGDVAEVADAPSSHGDGDYQLDLSKLADAIATPGPEKPASDAVGEMIDRASDLEGSFSKALAESERRVAGDESGLSPVTNRFAIVGSFRDVERMRLPRFVSKRSVGLFSVGSQFPFERKMLLRDFRIEKMGTGEVVLDAVGSQDLRQVDLDDLGELRVKRLTDGDARDLRVLFERYTPEKKRQTCVDGLFDMFPTTFKVTYGADGVRRFTRAIVDQMSEEQLDSYLENATNYARSITNAVNKAATRFARTQFEDELEIGGIGLVPDYVFPDAFVHRSPFKRYGKSLYEAEEGGMNDLESRMAEALANCDGIRWWHRIDERKKDYEFCINGYINHYPDFVAMTNDGRIIMVETKGDHLKNEESADKLALGRLWANRAGDGYGYFMVFDRDAPAEAGAYAFGEFETRILSRLS